MAIPDQILLSEKPATRQLFEQSKKAKGIWNSMVRIPKKELCFFEGARSFRYQKGIGNVYLLKGFSQDKDSLIRGFGRTIFLSEALDYMTKEYLNEETGEVDFLNTYEVIQGRFPLYGTILKGVACDLGTWEGYSYYSPTIVRFMRRGEGS